MVIAGNEVTESDPEFCGRCGQENPEYARFCRMCGALVDGSRGAWDILRRGMSMDNVRRLLGTPESSSASRHVTVWRYSFGTSLERDMRVAHVLFGADQRVLGWDSAVRGEERLIGQDLP